MADRPAALGERRRLGLDAADSHAPRNPQSALRRSHGAQRHRPGARQAARAAEDRPRARSGAAFAERLDRPGGGRRARHGGRGADDRDHAHPGRLPPERARAGSLPRHRRPRQLCQPRLFWRQCRLGEEAAAARRAAPRLGSAGDVRPGIADHPPRLCTAARRGRGDRRPGGDLPALRRAHLPPAGAARGASDRARAGAPRMDRARPARAARLARLAGGARAYPRRSAGRGRAGPACL